MLNLKMTVNNINKYLFRLKITYIWVICIKKVMNIRKMK